VSLRRACALALLSLAGIAASARATSRGTELWACWPRSHLSLEATAELVVLADIATTVQVDGAFTTPVRNVGPGAPLVIPIPDTLRLAAARTVLAGGFRVRSLSASAPISALLRVPRQAEASDDIARLVPTAELGTTYLVSAYQATLPNEPSYYAVIATQAATTVRAEVPCAGTTDVVVLGAGDVYQVFCGWRDTPADVTGALVTSDKPVAVLAGCADAYVPSNYLSGDFVVEAMRPVPAWGTDFDVTPLPKGPFAIPGAYDLLRIVASGTGIVDLDDGVTVTPVFLPAAGAFVDVQVTRALNVRSVLPIAAHVFACGWEMTDLGDPFMAEVPPRSEYATAFRSYVPPAYSLGSWAHLVVEGAAPPAVQWNGTPVTGFSPAPGGAVWARVDLGYAAGEHLFVADRPMHVLAYGYNDLYEPDPTLGTTPGSYGYPAADAVPICQSFAIIDAPGSACVGQTLALDAGASSIIGCPNLEFRWRADGALLPGCDVFVPDATCDVVFGGDTLYQVEIRCALDFSCTGGTGVVVTEEPPPPVLVGPDPAIVCAGGELTLDVSTGFVRYEWTSVPPDPGVTPGASSFNTYVVTPDVPTTYTVTATDVRGCPATGSVDVQVIPDPLPPPVDASLRVTKQGSDVHLRWRDIPGADVSGYDVVNLECMQRDVWRRCSGRLPDPVTIQASPAVALAVAVGVEATVHAGALDLGELIYYKVRGLSPCNARPGPTCNGWPRQLPPCP
jgi:hypothetical protein